MKTNKIKILREKVKPSKDFKECVKFKKKFFLEA